MKKSILLASLLITAFMQTANAVTKAEIKLIDPLEETRGWCVDLFAHLTGGLPIGGFQGHSCFLYMGVGPTEDQGFDTEFFEADQELRLWHFDMCMTLNEPNSGSFAATEECTGVAEQNSNGKIAVKLYRSLPRTCVLHSVHWSLQVVGLFLYT